MVDGLYSTGDRQQGQVHYNKARRIIGQKRLLEQNASGKYILKMSSFLKFMFFYFPKIFAISKLCSSVLCVKNYFSTEKENHSCYQKSFLTKCTLKESLWLRNGPPTHSLSKIQHLGVLLYTSSLSLPRCRLSPNHVILCPKKPSDMSISSHLC